MLAPMETFLFVLAMLAAGPVHGAKTSPDIKRQIAASKGDVDKIIDYVLNGAGRGKAYKRLADLGDKFGSRLTGSETLERAINFTVEQLESEGFDNVHTEPVIVPKWVRGEEWVKLIEPRIQTLPMLGLGLSVGTNGTPLEADVIVVNSFEELKQKGESEIRGKIVVYNQQWLGYSNTVKYRRLGASEAAQLGAVGVLVRSLTTFSLSTPHTGIQSYQPNVTQIPAASISIEDADMLNRMQLRGDRIRIRMYMNATLHGNTTSRNVIADITGHEFPNSLIILGGHIDSWDVGTGSMDDGGGVMIAWQALSVIKRLQLRPRRTLRLLLWTGEEQGIFGGIQYYNAHKDEVDNVSLIIESDHGAMKPRGIHFHGSEEAKSILEEACSMLKSINTTTVLASPISVMGADTKNWVEAGVPGVELFSNNENYFHYHHTIGDTLNVLDSNDLDLCTILWSTISVAVANLDSSLPHQVIRKIITSEASGLTTCYNVNLAIAITVTLVTRGWFTRYTWH